MIPETIQFDGLDLSDIDARHPRKLLKGSYPSNWVRHQWLIPADVAAQQQWRISILDRWIEKNIDDRWGSYLVWTPEGVICVVVFETVQDAVMFRLKGGERAWLAPEEEW